MTIEQQLARAERDCIDLHRALSEALLRMTMANVRLSVGEPVRVRTDDLLAVLERTSQSIGAET